MKTSLHASSKSCSYIAMQTPVWHVEEIIQGTHFYSCISDHILNTSYVATMLVTIFDKDIDTLERVWHHATKLVKSLSTLPYMKTDCTCSLCSATVTLQHGDVANWNFKILNDFTNIQLKWELLLPRTCMHYAINYRGHLFKLSKTNVT